MSAPYPKIHAPYKRDDRGRFIEGDWSRPEFAYLAGLPWRWTEKVDGTNIRLSYDYAFRGSEVAYIAGRTDRAQIPPDLLGCLVAIAKTAPFEEVFPDLGHGLVTLYGEGYGRSIQKGGEYVEGVDAKGVGFTVFDVLVRSAEGESLWLERTAVEEIASGLGLSVVPVLLEAPLADAEKWAAEGVTSRYGNRAAEGFVGSPLVPLLNRRGDRVITKVKTKDYRP